MLKKQLFNAKLLKCSLYKGISLFLTCNFPLKNTFAIGTLALSNSIFFKYVTCMGQPLCEKRTNQTMCTVTTVYKTRMHFSAATDDTTSSMTSYTILSRFY